MTTERKSFDYMNPVVVPNLPQIEIPLVTASAESLQGFGELVSDYKNHPVEIVTWPTQGWRSVDVGTKAVMHKEFSSVGGRVMYSLARMNRSMTAIFWAGRKNLARQKETTPKPRETNY